MLGTFVYGASLQMLCLQLAGAISLNELQARNPTQALAKISQSFSHQSAGNNLTTSTEIYKATQNLEAANATFEIGAAPYLSYRGEKVELGSYKKYAPSEDLFDFGIELVDHDLLTAQCQQAVYSSGSAASWCAWHLHFARPGTIDQYWAAIASSPLGSDVGSRSMPSDWLSSGAAKSYEAFRRAGKRATIKDHGVYFAMVDIGQSNNEAILDAEADSQEQAVIRRREIQANAHSEAHNSLQRGGHRGSLDRVLGSPGGCRGSMSKVSLPKKASCARIYSSGNKLGYTFAYGLDEAAVQSIDCSKFEAETIEYRDIKLSNSGSIWETLFRAVHSFTGGFFER